MEDKMDDNNMYQNQSEGGLDQNQQPAYSTGNNDSYANNSYSSNDYGNNAGSNDYSNNNYNNANSYRNTGTYSNVDNYSNANTYNNTGGYNGTGGYGGNSYNNYGNVYQQSVYSPDLEEPVSIGEWVITYLIMLVPCVNIVMMFVWAFSKTTKKSKSNFFKVQLILAAIILALYLLFVIIIVATGMGFRRFY